MRSIYETIISIRSDFVRYMNGRLLIWTSAIVVALALMFTISSTRADEIEKSVVPGIETFLEQNLDWIEGKRVGLVTNPTGVDRELQSSADLLFEHPDVELTALFGPEHGIRGSQEAGEYIESYTDERTGLPVYSLYGPTWKPSEDMLKDVDVLLFDIQDISSNVYTYIYTLGFVMEAAADYDKELIVLDRPNPLGGERVEGPVRSPETISFMGRYLLPVRHGMTVGELATMWNHEYSLGVSLKVAEMDGWERDMYFEDTGLPWVMTSPNIPTMETGYLYAGTELLDDTSLSTGLGTTKPFQLLGAPWIDGEDLVSDLRDRNLPGVAFRSAYFTPMSGTYSGELIGGVEVHIKDIASIDLVELGLNLVDAMRDQNPDKFKMTASYANLIGDPDVPGMIMDNMPVDDIMASWETDLEEWIDNVWSKYLLYGPYPEGAERYEAEGNLGILPHDISAAVGETVDIQVAGFAADGSRLDINPADIQWTVNGDIGYIEDGQFHATEDGVGQVIATYEGLTATRDIDVSATAIENIRFGSHPTYTRVVFDLNKTINAYEITEAHGKLEMRIPFGEISGELDPEGGIKAISSSPVLTEVEYYKDGDDFVAVFDLKVDHVGYETPTFSERIVIDLLH